MTLRLRSAAVSDLGLIRSNNEDAAFAGQRIMAVADGIGGAPAGEVASEIVIGALRALEDAPVADDPEQALRDALAEANRQIGAAAEADPARQGMGTTITALMVAGGQLALLHVGDSRGYLLREGNLTRLTRDDTLVQELVDRGVLTADDARDHPQRSIITQSVQGGDFAAAVSMITPQTGDRYLLCSDGLSDYVSDGSIAQAMERCQEPQPCAEHLVRLALRAGAPDNVTVIVCDVVTAPTGHSPPQPLGSTAARTSTS